MPASKNRQIGFIKLHSCPVQTASSLPQHLLQFNHINNQKIQKSIQNPNHNDLRSIHSHHYQSHDHINQHQELYYHFMKDRVKNRNKNQSYGRCSQQIFIDEYVGDRQFSSFHYKYPADTLDGKDSHNEQFSLFVLNGLHQQKCNPVNKLKNDQQQPSYNNQFRDQSQHGQDSKSKIKQRISRETKEKENNGDYGNKMGNELRQKKSKKNQDLQQKGDFGQYSQKLSKKQKPRQNPTKPTMNQTYQKTIKRTIIQHHRNKTSNYHSASTQADNNITNQNLKNKNKISIQKNSQNNIDPYDYKNKDKNRKIKARKYVNQGQLNQHGEDYDVYDYKVRDNRKEVGKLVRVRSSRDLDMRGVIDNVGDMNDYCYRGDQNNESASGKVEDQQQQNNERKMRSKWLKRIKSQQIIPNSSNYQQFLAPASLKPNNHQPSNLFQNKNNIKNSFNHYHLKHNIKQVSESSYVEQSQPSFLADRLRQLELKRQEISKNKTQLQEIRLDQKRIKHNILLSKVNEEHVQNQIGQSKNQDSKKSGKLNIVDGMQEVSQEVDKKRKQEYGQSRSLKSSSQSRQSSSSQQQQQSQQYKSSSSQKISSNRQQQFFQQRNNNFNQVQNYKDKHGENFYNDQQHYYKPRDKYNIKRQQIEMRISKSKKQKIGQQQIPIVKFQRPSNKNIIRSIQKRSQNMGEQQLDEYSEKIGVTKSKGGICFNIDVKQFNNLGEIQKTEQGQQQNKVHYTPNIPEMGGKTNINKKSAKHMKQQLLRRRQMARNYDRYARQRVFNKG